MNVPALPQAWSGTLTWQDIKICPRLSLSVRELPEGQDLSSVCLSQHLAQNLVRGNCYISRDGFTTVEAPLSLNVDEIRGGEVWCACRC